MANGVYQLIIGDFIIESYFIVALFEKLNFGIGTNSRVCFQIIRVDRRLRFDIVMVSIPNEVYPMSRTILNFRG